MSENVLMISSIPIPFRSPQEIPITGFAGVIKKIIDSKSSDFLHPQDSNSRNRNTIIFYIKAIIAKDEGSMSLINLSDNTHSSNRNIRKLVK